MVGSCSASELSSWLISSSLPWFLQTDQKPLLHTSIWWYSGLTDSQCCQLYKLCDNNDALLIKMCWEFKETMYTEQEIVVVRVCTCTCVCAWTEGFMHTKHVFYHWGTLQPHMMYILKYIIKNLFSVRKELVKAWEENAQWQTDIQIVTRRRKEDRIRLN
jgi:hypothetical protein